MSTNASSRWAAKEAVIKACKPRRISFSSIEVLYDRDEPYAIVLDDPAAMRPPMMAPDHEGAERSLENVNHQQSALALSLNLWRLSCDAQPQDFASMSFELDKSDEVNGQAVKLSISHDGEYVVAVCLAPEIV